MIKVELRRFNTVHGTEANVMTLVSEPVKMLDEMTEPTFRTLLSIAKDDPDGLMDSDLQYRINGGLCEQDSYFVLIKDDEVLFAGSSEFDEYSSDIVSAAESLKAEALEPEGKVIYSDKKSPLLLKVGNVSFTDGADGRFVLVTDTGILISKVRTALDAIIILAVLSIFITAFVIIAWLFTGVIRPIDSLRKAAKEIGSGNLNFKLEREEKDEIGELCSDFEEMRRHLKTQIDSKDRYELDVREMVSNVSHDLKTPLTAIKGYAEGLLDGVADNPEKRNKYLKTIVVKAIDMTTLVDELSYFSKLDTNKLPYKFELLNAKNFFEDCFEDYSIELEMKNFATEFASEISPDIMVLLDVEQIRRVMNNLIGNAVKYRDENKDGKITVRLTDAEDSVRISVADNGIGISRASLPHIFDRFYRADKSRTAGRAGTGIGLAIVRKIVEEHGGRVFARSELGIGTTISFTIKKGAKQNGNQNINS